MKKSLILQLANLLLQDHHFRAEAARASLFAGEKSTYELAHEKHVITENTIAGLTMLTVLALTVDEGDSTGAAYQTLRTALRDFKLSRIPPEPFNEELRG